MDGECTTYSNALDVLSLFLWVVENARYERLWRMGIKVQKYMKSIKEIQLSCSFILFFFVSLFGYLSNYQN